MEGIKKKMDTLRQRRDEANDKLEEYEARKKEMELRADSVS